MGDSDVGSSVDHPLLSFDPFAGQSPFVEDVPFSPEGPSGLQLHSIAPLDFASELDYHFLPSRCTALLASIPLLV